MPMFIDVHGHQVLGVVAESDGVNPNTARVDRWKASPRLGFPHVQLVVGSYNRQYLPVGTEG